MRPEEHRLTPSPYLVTGPALISFSGGRTSGKMLRRILDTHGGSLPADVHAVFCNTGKEVAATYDFVAEMAARTGIRIVWIERDWTAGFGFGRSPLRRPIAPGAPSANDREEAVPAERRDAVLHG